jgi:predicted nucleic acid-binding protein
VKLFLGTSVLIAAIGSDRGTARFIIEEAAARGWELITADYCAEETQRNWSKLRQSPAVSAYIWKTVILPKIKILPVRLVLNKPLLLSKTKDRPVVISALAAECDWLITFDKGDFHAELGQSVYGVSIGTPKEFLLGQIRQGMI